MRPPSWFIELDQVQSSYLLMGLLAALAVAGAVLFQLGIIGWVVGILGVVVRGGIRKGFLLWERLLAWALWPLFLAIVIGFLVVGGLAGGSLPALVAFC